MCGPTDSIPSNYVSGSKYGFPGSISTSLPEVEPEVTTFITNIAQKRKFEDLVRILKHVCIALDKVRSSCREAT